jgi:ribosomal protein S18 acetylase RimI-like enzyme
MPIEFFPASTPLSRGYHLIGMTPAHAGQAARFMAVSDPWKSYGFDSEMILDFLENSRRAGMARVVVKDPPDSKSPLPGQQAIGVVCLQPAFLGGRIVEVLAVDAPWRGRGLGRAIIDALCREMPVHMRDLFLLASVNNPKALEFYRHLGFRDVGDLPGLIQPDKSERLVWLRFR